MALRAFAGAKSVSGPLCRWGQGQAGLRCLCKRTPIPRLPRSCTSATRKYQGPQQPSTSLEQCTTGESASHMTPALIRCAARLDRRPALPAMRPRTILLRASLPLCLGLVLAHSELFAEARERPRPKKVRRFPGSCLVFTAQLLFRPDFLICRHQSEVVKSVCIITAESCIRLWVL